MLLPKRTRYLFNKKYRTTLVSVWPGRLLSVCGPDDSCQCVARTTLVSVWRGRLLSVCGPDDSCQCVARTTLVSVWQSKVTNISFFNAIYILELDNAF